MLQSMRDLHPDGRAELEEWARSGHPDAPPAAEHLDRDIFMHLIGADADGSIRRGSAADAAGHRWEHLAAVVETGGADALYALCDELFRGTAIARSAGMTWIFGGRLIALRKPGDSPERRRLRPIGMGTILLRLIGSCAARQFAPTFGAQFDPATQEDVDEDSEMWRLLQAGVACPGGTQQVQHTIRELLAEHPDWLVMKIDARNAFNTCSRATFFRRLLERAPGLYSWVHCCYSAPTRRYVRMEDGSFQVVWSTAGTTQGDPLGPALFSFAMLALQEQLAALVSAGQLFYLDDGHCVGPAETLAEFASAIVQPDGEHDMERTTGCAVEVTKCSVWGHDHIEYSSPTEYPAERTREEFDMQAASEGRDIFIGEDEEVDGVLDRQYGGDPLHASRHLSRRAAEARSRLRELFPSRLHGMRGLREPDSLGAEEAIQERAASRGLVVLGSPVCGTHDFMRAELESTIARAREYIDRAREILLPPHPDAYLGLMRVTLPPRFVHHCLCVPPSLVAPAAAAFDQLVLRAYTTVVGSLQSDHLPASDLALMPRQFGGQDFRSSASVAEALYLGAHALSTHRVWRRAPLLRALPSSRLTMPAWTTGQHRTHPPERTIREHMCLTHREEVRAGRDRFEGTLLHAAAWQSLIPEGMRIPSEQPCVTSAETCRGRYGCSSCTRPSRTVPPLTARLWCESGRRAVPCSGLPPAQSDLRRGLDGPGDGPSQSTSSRLTRARSYSGRRCWRTPVAQAVEEPTSGARTRGTLAAAPGASAPAARSTTRSVTCWWRCCARSSGTRACCQSWPDTDGTRRSAGRTSLSPTSTASAGTSSST